MAVSDFTTKTYPDVFGWDPDEPGGTYWDEEIAAGRQTEESLPGALRAAVTPENLAFHQERNAPKPTLSTVEPYVPKAYKPTESETVQGRLTGLLESGSPYVTAAEEGAKRYAQSRGMLNTTMAGTGGRKAAIESALPIASQDAATFAESGLLSQRYGQDVGLVREQELASGRLSTQDATEALELSKQQETATTLRQETELAVTQSMNAMDLTSSENRALGSAVTVLGQDLMGKIANIQASPDLSPEAKTTIVQGLNASYIATVNSISSIYGVQIEWA